MSNSQSNSFKKLEQENIQKFQIQKSNLEFKAIWNRVKDIQNEIDLSNGEHKKSN